MANKVLMTIKDVSVTYTAENGGEDYTALTSSSFDINEGDFICLLGPSGCGKSTLLNTLAGLLEPTTGTITMQGEEVKGISWKRAVVFQTPTLYPWLTTYENVAFGPKMRGVDAKETAALVDKYLEHVGLTNFKDSKPYELSGGMRQRAALARVLVNDPQMILMDEPFGALDALTRENMQKLVRDIWRKTNKTMFLITHDVDEALTLGNRVMVMSARPGKIIKEYNLDFSTRLEEGDEDVRYAEDYLKTRKEILKQIQV